MATVLIFFSGLPNSDVMHLDFASPIWEFALTLFIVQVTALGLWLFLFRIISAPLSPGRRCRIEGTNTGLVLGSITQFGIFRAIYLDF